MDLDYLFRLTEADADGTNCPAAERALRQQFIPTDNWKFSTNRSRRYNIRPQINDPAGILRSLRDQRSGPGMRHSNRTRNHPSDY